MTGKISYNIIMNGWKNLEMTFVQINYEIIQEKDNFRDRNKTIKFVPRRQNFLSESQITQDESDSLWSQILNGI